VLETASVDSRTVNRPRALWPPRASS
jgi:hypothetical protein